jgi:hypothetical protein
MNIHRGSPAGLGGNVTGLGAHPLPAVTDLHISDDLPQSVEANRLRLMTNAAST